MKKILFLSIAAFAFVGCKPRSFNSDGTVNASKEVSANARIDAMRRAEVWIAGSDAKVAERDLMRGPNNDLFDAPQKELSCRFVEPDPNDPPGGRTPKFGCEFDVKGEKKKLKVKYDPLYNMINGTGGKPNLEVYGEILATRLMWALGFAADKVYTARVKCIGCPPDPWLYLRKKTNLLDFKDKKIGFVRSELLNSNQWEQKSDRDFHPAVIEVKFKGDALVMGVKEGWVWKELFQHMANPTVQKPQRDALTILMSFINHMDNKDAQQRLVCEKESWNGEHCENPIMMVQDAGSSFGNGWAPLQGDIKLNKIDLNNWTKLSVWSDMKNCVVNVHGAPNASLRDTWKVSEEGRQFLANLMGKLSEKQVRDLFLAARVSLAGTNPATTDDWVDAFMTKMKRDIINARCQI